MTSQAQSLLNAFDALPIQVQHEVAVAILRRTGPSEDIPETALHELADELFQSYDAEEAGRADVSPR